ncbi:MAG: TlpA family protein disulfide reductase [Myxococcales bacterium]|nr:TlpA family protein disulfide reductase [Myxococcales bacterium]
MALLGGALIGCSPGPAGSPPQGASRSGSLVRFDFPLPGGGHVGSTDVAGRATAVLFITTFDLPSQALAKRVDDVLRSHTPRANAIAVVLEAPKYADLAQAFGESLSLSYPVAMADQASLQGDGPFGDIHEVPVMVVLDYEGREVARFPGVATVEQIEDALSEGAR